MSFPMVTVRSLEHAPDARFPLMAAPGTGRLVTLEPGDGAVSTLRVREVAVRSQLDGHVREVVHVRRHGSELMVTDARVVVCSTHVEGRSIVTGHVRYPWLVAVGGSRADGRHGLDELRLIVQAASGDYAVLTLGFDRHVDWGADVYGLAAVIADRAGRSWLREHPGADSARRSEWAATVGARRKVARPGEFALHWMPEYERVPEAATGALSPAV
ncbi:hypothetical protein [Nocardioides cavernaquae]|uniref:Uncharacterized protein n=1 Tax=Nocardioides cavernaquae TaxID=2321396 RepID=A0A3A5H650_9ACTN|nr:hypothetical protein [Nocardioides cavernaquae]RJS45411.1 hypothetical protein D4739_03700 [Nocardioides cavernaquae]